MRHVLLECILVRSPNISNIIFFKKNILYLQKDQTNPHSHCFLTQKL